MTAPARTAAFQALVAIDADRADLPAALATSRASLADDRDRALTADIVTGHASLAAQPRPSRRALRQTAADEARPDVLAILRLSLFQLLHLDRVPAAAVVDDAVNLTRAARKSSAIGIRQCRAALDAASAASSCRCRRGRATRPTATRRSPISASRTRIPTGSSRAGWIATGSTQRSVGAVQQRCRPADASRQHAAAHARAACRNASRATTSRRRRHATRRTVSSSRRAIRCAPPKTTRSSSRTKRRSSCRSWSTRSLASGFSISARRRAARRSRWPRPWTTRARSSPATCAPDASALLSDTVRAAARATCTSSTCRRSGPLPFAGRSIACSWMRPAPAWARSAAIPISAGGARRAICRVSREQQVDLLTRAADAVRLAAACVRHLLQRARGERSASSRRSSSGRRSIDSIFARRITGTVAAAARRPRHAANAAVRTRPRGVLRGGDGSPGPVRPLVVRSAHQMRLGTRVWSVGKFFLLVGALGATFLIFFGISMRVALRAREVEVPVARRPDRQRGDRDTRRRSVSALRVDDNRRADAKVPLGRVMQQDPGAGMRARRQRTIRVWVSSGPRVDDRPRPGRPDRAHRADSPRAGRRPDRHALGDPIARLSRRRRRGAEPAAGRRARRKSRCSSTAANRRRPT